MPMDLECDATKITAGDRFTALLILRDILGQCIWSYSVYNDNFYIVWYLMMCWQGLKKVFFFPTAAVPKRGIRLMFCVSSTVKVSSLSCIKSPTQPSDLGSHSLTKPHFNLLYIPNSWCEILEIAHETSTRGFTPCLWLAHLLTRTLNVHMAFGSSRLHTRRMVTKEPLSFLLSRMFGPPSSS